MGDLAAQGVSRGQIITQLAQKNRIALLGDSIAELSLFYTNVPTSVGSFVVSNGTGTITLSSNTSVFTGNYFSLNNISDVNLTLADNGTFPQAISASTPTTGSSVITFASKMPNGDYSNSFSGTWQVADVCQNADTGLITWLNAYLRGQYMITANYACVGETSVTTLAKISRVIAGVPFDIAFLACDGINDLSFLTPAATAYAYVQTVYTNYVSAIQQLQAAGKKVWVQIGPPCNQNTGSGSQVNSKCFLQLRQMMAAYCQTNDQVVVFDSMKEFIAGQSTTGGFTTNSVGQFTNDATHPNANAYSSMAANESSYLLSQIKPSEISQVSILDDNFNYAAAQFGFANFAQGSGMAGTTGTLTAGTGTVQAGATAANTWTLACVGASTINAASVGNFTPTQVSGTNSQNYGYAQRVSCTAAAVNQGFTLKSGIFYTNAVFPGWYRFGVRVYVRSATTGLGALFATYGVGPKNMNFGGNGGFDVGYALPAGTVLWLTSGPLYLSAQPSIGQLIIEFLSAAAGSVDLEISAPFIRPIANPYQ